MELPYLAPEPVMSREHAREALQGLAPGWYSSHSLYERYTAVMRGKGLDPAHPVSFGQMLGAIGATRRKKKIDKKSVYGWVISRADTEGERWSPQPPPESPTPPADANVR